MSDPFGAKTLRTDPTQFGGHQHGQKPYTNPVYSLDAIIEVDEYFLVENSKGDPSLENSKGDQRQEWGDIEVGDIATTKRGQYQVVNVVPMRSTRNLVSVVPYNADIPKPDE